MLWKRKRDREIERVKNTSLIIVSNEFVERVAGRKQIFGQFSSRNLTVKTVAPHKGTQA